MSRYREKRSRGVRIQRRDKHFSQVVFFFSLHPDRAPALKATLSLLQERILSNWRHLFVDGEYAQRQRILSGLTLEQVTRQPSERSHSIYEELWHAARWGFYVNREIERTYMFRRILSALGLVLILCQTSAISRSTGYKKIGLTVPAAPWTLTLPGENFAIEREQVKPDGQYGYFLMSDKKNHMMLSVFIEPAVKCKDSKSCRDMVWKAGNPSWENPQNVVLSEIDGVHFFEFLIPSFRDQPIQQQNMYAQFVVDGFWVDMHISKVLYKPEEHKMFERIIKSVKFEPKQDGAPPKS